MKITIRHPAGLEVSFEGDEAEFERFSQLLAGLPNVFGAIGTASDPQHPALSGGEDYPPAVSGQIDVRRLAETMNKVGTSTDIERVTVMAYAAKEAGLGGIDYSHADRLFEELGQPKPTKIRATFSNAKTKGYVRSVGAGVWLPTVTGENFAKYGQRARQRRGQQGSASNGGGEPD